jgi:hypothetical protein
VALSSFFEDFFRARARKRSTPEEFEKSFLSLMQMTANFLRAQGYLKRDVEFRDLKMGKYSGTHVSPFKPLTPISSVDEIVSDEMLFMYISLKSEKEDEEFFGNFRVDETGSLVPEGYDADKADILPEDVDTDQESLKDKAVDFLKEHVDEIWNTVVLVANLALRLRRVRGS